MEIEVVYVFWEVVDKFDNLFVSYFFGNGFFLFFDDFFF